jgi:hypothetical protein
MRTELGSNPDVLQIVVVSPHDDPWTNLPGLLAAISNSIRLRKVVDLVTDSSVNTSPPHHLRGMLCFTLNHYIALFPTTEGQWMYCDDNTTKLVRDVAFDLSLTRACIIVSMCGVASV